MAGGFAVLAGVVVLFHFAFVVFAATGALLAIRWRWVPWLHMPAAAWAVYIELSGGICPLTSLENDLRAKAGLSFYSGDFVGRYFFPVLYPGGLTREAQLVLGLGLAAVALNIVLYTFVCTRRRRRASTP